MVFWSDTTDRKSPVPGEAINISHLPRQSGQGRGRCQEGDGVVTRPEPAKATRGQPFRWAAGMGGQAGTENSSVGCVGSGGRGIVPQNKESAIASAPWAPCHSAPQLPAHLCATHSRPPEREAWRAGKGGKQVPNTWAQSIHPHCPPGPRCICCQQGQYFFANPAYHKHTPSPTPVLPSEPMCSHTHIHTHTHAFM